MDERTLVKMYMENDIVGGTDGSVNECRFGISWGYKHAVTEEMIVKSNGAIPNAPEDANSTRAEMFAVVCLISYVGYLCEKITVKNEVPNLTLYTDSQSTILNSEKTFFPTAKNSFENDIDIKLQLKDLLSIVPMKVQLYHVKSHQDKNKPWEDLSFSARLNCEMDEHVNMFFRTLRRNYCHSMEAPFLPAQKLGVKMPFERPSSFIADRILSFKHGHEAETTMSNIWKISKHDLRLLLVLGILCSWRL